MGTKSTDAADRRRSKWVASQVHRVDEAHTLMDCPACGARIRVTVDSDPPPSVTFEPEAIFGGQA